MVGLLNMNAEYLPDFIERKWISKWEQEAIFESEPNDQEKYFITVPYPYLNGILHAGHTRTFTIGDVIARHKRMQGLNVLFPMGFHVTGTPIVGLAELIKNRDPQTIEVYSKHHGIPESKLHTLESPEKIVDFFSVEAEKSMRSIGYSIDWRRKFTTTDDAYKKFIEWQFNHLYKNGYIVKGSHPVKWCPADDNPVEDHDILHGEGANIVDYTLIKFEYEGCIFPCATLRPETTFGVTNLWVNPEIEYVKIKVANDENDETWVVSKDAYDKLLHTDKDIQLIETVPSFSLIGIKVTNPLTREKVITLPASFVRGDNGSGIVMSVPAHAPFDYLALRDLYDSDLSAYGIDENPRYIKLISLIDVPEFSDYPAVDAVNQFNINSQNDSLAEDATKLVYKKEYHSGTLKQNTGKYANIKVSKIKDILTKDLIDQNIGELFYEFSEPVVCRCGTPCVVKMVKGQWFLHYSNPGWKRTVTECVDQMDIIPEELRVEFHNKIEWLKDKACARKKGLGTKLPFDKAWLIESLADSTIYMSYYILAKFLNEDIGAEQLTNTLLDYILLDIGSLEAASISSGLERELIEKIKTDFSYWYPVDIRTSGKDLVPNHLLFFLFHHVAIFGRDKWPKSIAINGFVSLEGKKMSKSKGPLLTMNEAVHLYGADVTRMYILSSAEQTQDADWKNDKVENAKKQLERFYSFAHQIIKSFSSNDFKNRHEYNDLDHIDKWFLSQLQQRIYQTNISLKQVKTRNALQNSFFILFNDVKWYQRRGGSRLLPYILDVWVRLMAPFTPHLCEEIWDNMEHTNGNFISLTQYPIYNSELIDIDAQLAEELVAKTLEDMDEILKVIKLKPTTIYLYSTPKWKKYVFMKALSMNDQGNLDVGLLIKELMKESEMKKYGKIIPKYAQKVVSEIKGMSDEKISFLLKSNLNETEVLNLATDFFEKETGCQVYVYNGDSPEYDPKNKAGNSTYLKPAIYVE